MNRTVSLVLAASLFVVLAAPAATFAQYQQQGFLFPYGTGAGAPREQLVVYAFGPSQSGSQSSYPWYQQTPQYGSSYTMPSYAAPSFTQPINNYVYSGSSYSVPTYSYPAYNSYNTPSYNSYPSYGSQSYGFMPSYSYPQYSSYSYPSYGYADYGFYGGGYGGYAQPTGGADFWGNPMCNWGYDYGNFPCDRDPHQWVYDSYSGEWY